VFAKKNSEISIKRYPKKYKKGVFLKKVAIKFHGSLQKNWLADLRDKDYPKNQEKLGAMNFGKIGNVYYNFEILANFK